MLRPTLGRTLAALVFAAAVQPGFAQAETIAGKCKLHCSSPRPRQCPSSTGRRTC